MSTSTVISVEGISKKYRLGVFGGATLADDLKMKWAKVRGKPNPLAPLDVEGDSTRDGDHFWALRNLGFEVKQGEILGVIGKNGAGKSTLLKLLSQITGPTSGSIKIKGRTASLLEVGTGFHPELTGRENIFLNGAVLGMKKAEIKDKVEEIIAFSGIKHHIDTPVKRYSSGMKVRLGFAVAAHLEPEILIVDEVLAVGDAEFQRKCLGKMKDVAGSGRTILFVSHNMSSIRSLCSRVVWLSNGTVQEDGPTEEVVRNYLNNYVTSEEEIHWMDLSEAPGIEEVKLVKVALRKESTDQLLLTDQSFKIEIGFVNLGIDDGDLRVNIHLINSSDITVLASALVEGLPRENIGKLGEYTFQCEVPANLLNSDDYRVAVNFVRRGKLLWRCDDTIGFQIHNQVNSNGISFGRKIGVVRPILNWVKV